LFRGFESVSTTPSSDMYLGDRIRVRGITGPGALLLFVAFAILGLLLYYAQFSGAVRWLLGLGIDIAFGGNRRSDPYAVPWTFEVARWLPMAVVGLAIWAWHWSGVLARRRRDPEGEANSTIRRGFLYLTLGVGVVVALASATLTLYRLVGVVVGADLSGNAVSELSTPIGAAAMAAIALVYHGLLLRADQQLRPVAAPSADIARSDCGRSDRAACPAPG